MTVLDRLGGVREGQAVKSPVRVATTANITLSGLQTVDGVVLVTNDRVLVKDQTDAKLNGIYVASAGDWQRATDFSGFMDVVKGTKVYVTDGDANGGASFSVTASSVTFGTTNITFTRDVVPSAIASGFGTRALAAAATIPSGQDFIQTAGYSTAGDGGGALYKRVSSEPSHAGKFQSADGAWFEIAEEVLSPLMLGAKGDGTTDDTTALNNTVAIGRPVYVPSGTWMVDADAPNTNHTSGGWAPPSGSRIKLHPLAVIKAIPTDATSYCILRLTDVSDVHIEGGTIQGERDDHNGSTGEHGHGIVVRGGSDIWIRDAIVKDCWGDGIYIGRDSVSTNIPTRVFMSGVVSTGNRRNAFTPAAVHDGIFIGCQFNLSSGTAPQAGVDLEPAADSFTVKNIAFIGCQASGNASRGFVIDDRPTSIIEGVIFDGCIAADNGAEGFRIVQIRKGMVVNACQALNNGDAGISLSQCSYAAIRNCHAAGNAGAGIALGDSCIGCSMTGNFSEGNQYGIQLAEAGSNAPKQCVISGNNARLNDRHGVWIRLGSDNLIEGNICSENGQETDATYDNIRLEAGATLNRVANNICRRGSETNQPAYGINMANGASNIIEGNDLRTGGKTAAFRNNVATTIQRGNQLDGIVSFASTDTTPSVATGDVFKTANASATTITTFDDGHVGQRIEVIIGDANTTIDFSGTTLKGNAGADLTAGQGDSLACVYDGTNWYCSVRKAA